jgi:uncharacterized protein YcfJ
MQSHNNKHNNKVSPTVAIAATSAIIFSAMAVGVIAGVIPNSTSKSARAPAPVAPQAAAAVVLVAVGQPKAMAAKKREPVHLVSADLPPRAAASKPVRPGICSNCGSVVSIDVIQHEGEDARPRTIATVVGISGGAYAGHEIEKHANGDNTYNVAVRMDDGSSRGFDYDAMPAYRAGDKVKVVDGRLVSR